MRPFHYSFLVRELDEARRFYGELLQCPEGRSTERWVDFDFFGNQISAHVSDDIPSTRPLGKVDEVTVPMPHFGAVLEWEQFQSISARLVAAGIEFVIAPSIRFAGQTGEQAVMFLLDGSGNAIEFKAFRNEAELFAS